MSQYQIGILKDGDLKRWWPDIEQVLLIDGPRSWMRDLAPAELLQMAEDGEIDIWAAGTDREFQLLIITRVLDTMGGRALRVEFAYGKNLDELMPQLSAMIDLCAQVRSCEVIVILGREGWRRKLAQLGYEFEGVLLEKRVVKERVH